MWLQTANGNLVETAGIAGIEVMELSGKTVIVRAVGMRGYFLPLGKFDSVEAAKEYVNRIAEKIGADKVHLPFSGETL